MEVKCDFVPRRDDIDSETLPHSENNKDINLSAIKIQLSPPKRFNFDTVTPHIIWLLIPSPT